MKTAERVSVCGFMTALSMVLAYIEAMLPVNLGFPGAKLGLPNLVTVLALWTLGARPAFLLSVLRIVLTGLSFGNPFAMWYSFCGFILSFAVMLLLKKTDCFGVAAISAAGGAAHNIGQLLCALFLVKTPYILSLLPFLLPAGVLAGVLVGVLSGLLTKRLRRFLKNTLDAGKGSAKGKIV